MKLKIYFSLLFGLLLLFGLVIPVQADGIIIPTPCPLTRCPPLPRPTPCENGLCPHPISQLGIRYHHVTVKIENQVAVTHVDQVFYNPNTWPVEGEYIFPLPGDAVVSQFVLWVDGNPVEGKVLDADQARQAYEDIVNIQRDPALLEYIGRGAVQANIFPIPPNGERRIELEYSQALTADNGLVKYVYPLNTEKFSVSPLDSVEVKVDIADNQSIRAVYSPTHPVTTDRKDENHVTVAYEASNVTPDKDFALYYSLGETEAFHLFSYRDPADPVDANGFFMLLLAPSPQPVDKPIAKDVLLVLDHSGSMDGEKFQQAQSALRYILTHLNPEDRFYLETFSTTVQVYSSDLRPASEAAQAIDWVGKLAAEGSTDINRALLEAAAVADKERTTYLIFLTDGLPTEGVTDTQEIIRNFDRSATANLRLFPFGVGYDVDTILLDTLSENHHGQSTYVQPGQSLDEALSGFYAKISTPLLTNLKLDFGKLVTYDIYPNPLPDLFVGSQVVVVGRYHTGGATDVSLTGDVNGTSQTFNFPQQVFTADSRSDVSSLAELPRLWATRKIGFLLNKIRLQGADQETIEQIVKLSIRYGIVTPYTSYLVTEPSPIGAENQARVAQQALKDYNAQPTEASGAGAVQKAAGEGSLSQAEIAPGVSDESGQQIRTDGTHTFVFTDGKWIDTAYDPDKMKAQQVAFLSPDYFALAQSRPDVGAALAIGDKMILVIDGKAYEITAEGSPSDPVDLPATLTPAVVTPTEQSAGTATPAPMAQVKNTALPQPPAASGNTSSPLCTGAALPMAGLLGIWLIFKARILMAK
jgi:Ca-activated chloride channel family protein